MKDMHRYPDITNRKYGRLTAKKYVGSDRFGNAIWLCECECGNKKEVRATLFRTGNTSSCGCLAKELARARLKKTVLTHGMSKTKIYSVWFRMKSRCNREKDPAYKWYGGRGITVCERWNKFENFYKDMGKDYREGLTLDRTNNDGNYEPSNCRWVSQEKQHNNMSNNVLLTLNGKTQTLPQMSRKYGIKQKVLRNRVCDLGWTTKRALTTPVKKYKLGR